jgi:hypothetical protein
VGNLGKKHTLDGVVYEFFRSFDFYILSPCFFRVKRLDEMLQISTHHRLVSDDGLLLIAHPPNFTSSSTTLSSSYSLLPVVKFMVGGECGIYFGRGRFVTFREIETHPQNLIRSRHHSDGELSNSSSSDPRLHSTWVLSRGASLFIWMKVFRHFGWVEWKWVVVGWVDVCSCYVCWCSTQISPPVSATIFI